MRDFFLFNYSEYMLSFIYSWRRRTSLASSVHDEGKDRREHHRIKQTKRAGKTRKNKNPPRLKKIYKKNTRGYGWGRKHINRIYSPSMITIAMKNVQFTIFVLFAHKLLIVSSKDSFFSLQFFFLYLLFSSKRFEFVFTRISFVSN